MNVVTWSQSATISDSTFGDRWLNFFDNHLNALTKWSVSAHPNGNPAYRSLSYNFTDHHDSSAQAYYYWWSGATLYEDATYTTTPGDLGTDTTNAVSGYSGINNPWKVWTSDQNAGSIIMTEGKKIIFLWADPVAMFNPNKTSWDGSTDRGDAIIYPLVEPSNQFGGNHGQGGTSTTEYAIVPDVCKHHSSASAQSSVDLYYDTWGYVGQSSQNFAPFTKISQNDILVQVPGNGIGNTGSSSIFSSSQVTIFDGTNYYIRTNANLSYSALLFDFGITEPVF